MGIFSSKKVTTVGTNISRIIKDEQLPDSIRSAMITSMYTDDDFIDSILEASISSLSNRAERMYAYVKKDTEFGLPSGEIYSDTQGFDQVQSVLDTLEGGPVLIEYMRFGGTNLIHMAWMDLLEHHGYSIANNRLGVLSSQLNQDVYLEDMYVEFPASLMSSYDEKETTVWSNPPNTGVTPSRQVTLASYFTATKPVIINTLSVVQIRVKYIWEKTVNGQKQFVRDSFVMPVRYADLNGDYFHAKYEYNGQVKYWMYKYGSGVVTILDSVLTTSQTVVGDFYPNIYYRLNKTSIATDKSSQRYKSQKKMSGYIGVDFDDLCEGLHENPDIKSVEQAFLTFAVPADSTNSNELRYLYEFFDAVYQASPSTDSEYVKTTKAVLGVSAKYVNSKTISIKDNALEMSLIYDGMEKSRKMGKVSDVGEFTRGDTTATTEYGLKRRIRYYRKQITENFYDEIQVLNLVMKYNVDGSHQTTVGDDDSEIMLVPLDRGITRKYNSRDAENLYARSMHLVCNSKVVTTLKWYQQSWFGALLLVVAVVITVASLGADGGSAITAALAFLSTATALEIAMVLAYKILIYFAIREGFKIFVKAVGPEVAMVAAVIAAAYGIQQTATVGATATTQVGLQAQTLLQISSGLTSAINTELQSYSSDLASESAAFNTFKETKQTELEEAMEDLDVTSLLSPFVILGESPSTFYQRTNHSGNIGTLVFDDIHNFVSRSLKLPDFSDTLGGITYG